MKEGYVKVYRRMLRSRVFKNEGLFKLWMWCLLRASHTGQWATIKAGKGSIEVHLSPGQFLYGRHSAAQELYMHPETVRKRIHKLKNMGNLTIQSTSHYSIITVVNWAVYQGDEKKVPPEVPAKYQPSTTNKNDKKQNIYSCNSTEFQLSELLLNLILKRRPTFKRPNLQKWAYHIDLMIREDKRDPEEIKKVIEWCQRDGNFWQNNILSTGKLREQHDQLALKMNDDKPKDNEEDPWAHIPK